WGAADRDSDRPEREVLRQVDQRQLLLLLPVSLWRAGDSIRGRDRRWNRGRRRRRLQRKDQGGGGRRRDLRVARRADAHRPVVAASSQYADVGGAVDRGSVYVWEGGSPLAGAPAPHATLTVRGAFASDELGSSGGQAVLLADVSGDGLLDVIAGSSLADRSKKT